MATFGWPFFLYSYSGFDSKLRPESHKKKHRIYFRCRSKIFNSNYRWIVSSLPGPEESILTDRPTVSSIKLVYSFNFAGNSS